MSAEQVAFAAKAWKRGFNTLDIATKLSLPESTVYRWIEIIKVEARRLAA